MAQARTNIWIDGSQAGSTLKELKKNVYALNREINDLPRNSDKYKQKVQELGQANAALKQHRDQIRGVGNSFGSANNGITGMIKKFAPMAAGFAVVSKAVSGIGAAIGSYISNNIKLEKSLSSLKSLTGASAEDVEFYKKEAIDMGKKTTLSATQVVDAFKLIGSNKPELLKNKQALADVTAEVITLAEAAEMDLGDAAQSVTGALNQFSHGADQASRYVNAFAAGSQAGPADIKSLSDAIDKSGSVMAGFNINIEEGIGLLETMGEKNIKGAEAGTKLRNVLLTMQSINALPKEALDQLEKFGVNIDLVADKTQPLNVRLEEMAKIQGDATAMTKVFGKENQVAAASILSSTEKVQEYTAAVTGTNTAYEQASINTDNLDGDLKSLGSAWEGLTLSMSGSEGVFRPIVQAGTDMLNWLSDTVTAVKDWDGLAMETQLLKLGKALTFFNPQLEAMYERQIKINEISSEVVDAIKDESTAMSVAIKTIEENNEKLQDANITEEEAARLKEQNGEFIDALNEKYPELTSQMDLNNATSAEFNQLQKDINKTLVEQAVNAAMAREAERLLDEIVQQSIRTAQLRREEQKMMKDGASYFELFKMGAGFQETSAQSEHATKKIKADFKDLGNVAEDVKKVIDEMGIDFGGGFQESQDVAGDALKEIERLTKKLAETTDVDKRRIIEAEIKAQQRMLETSSKSMTEAQRKAMELLKGQTEDQMQLTEETAAAAEAAEEAERKRKKAAEEARKEYEKLIKELEKVHERAKELQEDFDYKKRLDAFKDEQQKELFELEHTLSEKYDKEIAAAEELSKKKGDIGLRAQEELNALLILKEQELEYGKTQINERFAKERAAAEYQMMKDNNLLYLQQQETLEESIISLKVAKAEAGAKAINKADLAARRAAQKELEQALTEQAEFEKRKKIEALMDLESDMQITREEFNNRKEQIELEHLQNIEDIHDHSNERINQAMERRFEEVVGVISRGVDAINDLYMQSLENQTEQLNKSEKKELKALNEKFEQKLINEEDYNAKKDQINQRYENERRQLERKKAEAEKEAALFKAFIQMATSIVEASPNPFMIAAAIALGTAQIGLIAARPVPQFADGGYHNVIGAQDGKMYNAKYVGRPKAGLTPASPSLALMSEEGPEYFVPNGLLHNPVVAHHVAAIDAIRTNQFAEGGYTSSATAVGNDDLTRVLDRNAQMMELMIQILPGLSVRIPDSSIDEMNERQQEINQLRA